MKFKTALAAAMIWTGPAFGGYVEGGREWATTTDFAGFTAEQVEAAGYQIAEIPDIETMAASFGLPYTLNGQWRSSMYRWAQAFLIEFEPNLSIGTIVPAVWFYYGDGTGRLDLAIIQCNPIGECSFRRSDQNENYSTSLPAFAAFRDALPVQIPEPFFPFLFGAALVLAGARRGKS